MDLEIAKAIKNSAHWHNVEEEIDRWLQGDQAKIEVCESEDLPALQARIKALREVKRLPQIVIDRG